MTRAPQLVVALEQGAKIALVSDAGMPLVSDPVIAWCRCACAIDSGRARARTVSTARRAGSLRPAQRQNSCSRASCRSEGERRRALDRLRIEDRTIIIYEAPHESLKRSRCARDSGDRQACLAGK